MLELSRNKIYFWNEVDYGEFKFKCGKQIRRHVTIFARIEETQVP